MDFTFDLVERITNNFSDNHKVGSGVYGDVYMAVYNGEVIAIKKLYPMKGIDDRKFDDEFRELTKVCHKNVVRLFGYYNEINFNILMGKAEVVFSKVMGRVLCFEYIEGGSLDMYITDEPCGLDWPTCYGIIKETCEGLNHLHKAQERPIFHLGLKPANILLDKRMTAKIADIGLYRLVSSTRTHYREVLKGTQGYMPPEYIEKQSITKKFDVFSLGIIILKVIAGNMGYSCRHEMSPKEFNELVCESWTKRLQAMPGYYSSHEIDILRVSMCVEIALRCVETDGNRRPDIEDIVHELDVLEAEIRTIMLLPPDQRRSLLANQGPGPGSYFPQITRLYMAHNLAQYTRGIYIKFRLIEAITNGFSEDHKVGRDEYGDIYRAVHNGEEIAVKKLHPLHGLDDKEFDNKLLNFSKVHHKNILRFIGYCCESRNKCSWDKQRRKYVFAETAERVLCFEYMHGGSLDKYIADEPCGLDWPTCYNIIKGITEGLNHLRSLHKDLIFHLEELKPTNILLDKNMTPKITGLGLSKLVASNRLGKGTQGYMPQEYIECCYTLKNFDLFSLGVIFMKILAGNKGYSHCAEISPKQIIDDVTESWKRRLQAMSVFSSNEIHILQVRTCIEIALRCVHTDLEKSPSIEDIVHELKELEAKTDSEPYHVTLEYLKDITNNFCDERKLGGGGSGVVYKGVLENGEIIAVKKLLQSTLSSQQEFEKEIKLLMKLNHPNIVRLVGYCYETQHLHMPHEGKFIFAEDTQILLCLEYLSKGSLDKYTSDASTGLDWPTRCKIIEGISYGLHYLHEQPNDHIIHLDLKPANVLLDETMLPKITDFGLSRHFHQSQSIHTKTTRGTLGYMPPEFQRGIITLKSDIFSLGVIIMEVITGHRDYPYDIRESSQGFIELELQKWKSRLQNEMEYTSLEIDCKKIERCIQIGLICVIPERNKRPTTKKIIDMLQGLESMDWYISNEGSLQVVFCSTERLWKGLICFLSSPSSCWCV